MEVDAAGRRDDGLGLDGEPRVAPGGEAAVENAHVTDPRVAQQPPGARGGRAGDIVVDDHGVAVVEAPAPGGVLEVGLVGERMTPVRRQAVAGQLGVEVYVYRAGNVAAIELVAPGRTAQAPAHVEDVPRRPPPAGAAPEGLSPKSDVERGGGDQRREFRGHQRPLDALAFDS